METGTSEFDKNVQTVLRASIGGLLRSFAANPFFDLWECDPQARLLHSVREALEPSDVAAKLVYRRPSDPHRLPSTVRTSRVHTEMRLGAQRCDLVVFRSHPEVELTVYPAGALDVVASLREEDVVAVAEIKAAPSRSQEHTFREDLHKLEDILSRAPQCLGFFILLDKSLHLQGATSDSQPSFRWLDALVDDPLGRLEAHWLDKAGHHQQRLGRVHGGKRDPASKS